MGGVQHSHGLALYFGIAVAQPTVMVNFRPAATRGKRVDCAKFGVKRSFAFCKRQQGFGLWSIGKLWDIGLLMPLETTFK